MIYIPFLSAFLGLLTFVILYMICIFIIWTRRHNNAVDIDTRTEIYSQVGDNEIKDDNENNIISVNNFIDTERGILSRGKINELEFRYPISV